MYVLTALTAFDYAYSATTGLGGAEARGPPVPMVVRKGSKPPYGLPRLANDKGQYLAYGPIHVVNALSLLYTMVKIGALFGNSGYRVKKGSRRRRRKLEEVASGAKKGKP